jgi:predicted acyltransferase
MSDESDNCWNHWIDHAPWDGIHFADFVFPGFVFIVVKYIMYIYI